MQKIYRDNLSNFMVVSSQAMSSLKFVFVESKPIVPMVWAPCHAQYLQSCNTHDVKCADLAVLTFYYLKKSPSMLTPLELPLSFETHSSKPSQDVRATIEIPQSNITQGTITLLARRPEPSLALTLAQAKIHLRQSLSRRVLQIGALSLLALPVKSLMATDVKMHFDDAEVVVVEEMPTVTEEMVQTDTLSEADVIDVVDEVVVATINNGSTVFQHGEFVHGFGYDAVKRYADHLGKPMRLETYTDEESMLDALKSGDVDMVLGTSDLNSVDFSTNLIACDNATKDKLANHGLETEIGFTFLSSETESIEQSAKFLCSSEQKSTNQTVARFYDQTLFDNDYDRWHFERTLASQLPMYKHAFKMGADKHNHDWQLLAVISYQESHLNPKAVSRTGVQGLMMLTNDTAKEMGITNRTDAMQSIQGGARYLEKLDGLFPEVSESERLWFMLASYNMGPNAVKRIQEELSAQGKDPTSWSEVYSYLAKNASTNSRYVQCMHYVTNIRTYLEEIKTMKA